MLLKLRQRSQITLPAEVIKKLKLEAGDTLDMEIENGKIILKPVVIVDKSQAWFWSEEWQKGEKEAEEDIKKGRVSEAMDSQEFIRKMNL